jgi:hypothetical protein
MLIKLSDKPIDNITNTCNNHITLGYKNNYWNDIFIHCNQSHAFFKSQNDSATILGS